MDAVQMTRASATGDIGSSRTRKAAQDFESVLLANFLQEMQETAQDESDSGASDMKGLGVEQIARAWAQRGGVGIAQVILPYLEKQVRTSDTASLSKADSDVADDSLGPGDVGN